MSDRTEILVVGPTRPTKLDELGREFTLHRLDLADEPEALLAEVGARIRGVVTTGGVGLNRALLDRLPKLEIVSSSAVGYDKIDVDACSERGVVVTNTPDVLTDDVADAAIGLLIVARRNMVVGHDHVRSGRWGQEGSMALTSALRGKRLGIVGLGRIGSAIAKRAEAFGLEIGYTARSERTNSTYTYRATARDLAEWAEILVVVVPGSTETDGMIDAQVLDALGPDGTFINVARGSVVDETALIAALKEGRIANAALDVFWDEPNPNAELTQLPNVVLSPHHASGTTETRDAMAGLVNDNLRAFFAGRAPLTPVNADRV